MAYYLKNEEHNGIEIYFGAKPSADIIADLKAHHWRWLPFKSCWYHRYTAENESLARKYCEDKLETSENKSLAHKYYEDKAETSVKLKIVKKKEMNVEVPQTQQPVSIPVIQYPTTKYRLPDSIYRREPLVEKEYGIDDIKLYGYTEDSDMLYVIGEIFCKKKPKDSFCMICTIYDKDGDIIETTESRSYGSGLVTNMITPAAFFDGFPFAFDLCGIPKRKIKEICIAPASSY